MNRLYTLILALLITLTATPLCAAQPQVVRVGAFNYYPAIFKDTDGVIKGFYVDALAEIARRENIRFDYRYGSWSEGLERLRAGEVDVLTSVAHTPERARFMDYGTTPLLTVWGELYVPRESEIDGIRQVQGKTVAVMKGDVNAAHFVDLVKNFGISCRFVELPGFEEVFSAIAARKVDAGVVNSTYGAARQREYGLRSTGVVFNPFDIYFTVGKGKNGDILALLDRYLNSWRYQENSVYNRARQKWSHGTVGVMKVVPRWLSGTLAVLAIAAGVALAFVILLRMQVRRRTAELAARIAEREEAEAEKQMLMAQLSQSQKLESVGRLAGGIAHDFNNLLTPILGYAEIVKGRLPDENPDRAKLDSIIQAADKARKLTQQLLIYGRKQILDMQVIDLNNVVASFHDILRRTIRESIEIRLHLTPDVFGIRADRHQLEQIIMNLVVNANDAIRATGVITIETAPITLDEEYVRQHAGVTPGTYLMLVVTDTGCGMDEETLSHVFEPFFTTKGVGEGTGLGLATVYGLVKQHEGHIWVYSEPGKGTVFKIYFPVVDARPVAETQAVPAHATIQAAARTVLLVEDNEMVRGLVHDVLRGIGFEVIEAEGPKTALAASEGRTLDLLLTDVVMPDMTGPELHERILRTHPGLKVLYMSGYTDNVIVHHGMLDEGINFVQKPFTVKDLTGKIKTVLNGESPPSTP